MAEVTERTGTRSLSCWAGLGLSWRRYPGTDAMFKSSAPISCQTALLHDMFCVWASFDTFVNKFVLPSSYICLAFFVKYPEQHNTVLSQSGIKIL